MIFHFFNKEVIREALNNAIVHRDYKRTSEIIIKQSPQDLNVISPGGFPIGVTIDNLLNVNSTPRNRLLADILSKTGAVERAGQGIDKMFYQCLTEAKEAPSYSRTDDYQVDLIISAMVKDKAFALFIKDYQENRNEKNKLSVHEIITLDKIRVDVDRTELNQECLQLLLQKDLIQKFGKTRNLHYKLSPTYFSFIGKEGRYTKIAPIELPEMLLKIVVHLQEFKEAKMGDFVDIFEGKLTRDQIKTLIYKLSDLGLLDKIGIAKGTKYILGTKYKDGTKLIDRAVKLGIEEMKKRGELPKSKE